MCSRLLGGAEGGRSGRRGTVGVGEGGLAADGECGAPGPRHLSWQNVASIGYVRSSCRISLGSVSLLQRPGADSRRPGGSSGLKGDQDARSQDSEPFHGEPSPCCVGANGSLRPVTRSWKTSEFPEMLTGGRQDSVGSANGGPGWETAAPSVPGLGAQQRLPASNPPDSPRPLSGSLAWHTGKEKPTEAPSPLPQRLTRDPGSQGTLTDARGEAGSESRHCGFLLRIAAAVHGTGPEPPGDLRRTLLIATPSPEARPGLLSPTCVPHSPTCCRAGAHLQARSP